MKVIAFVSTVSAILAVAAAYGPYPPTPPPSTPSPPGITDPTPGPNLPCPRNYLFSCQPNLAPVACRSAGVPAGFLPFGAFSENVPVYVNPAYGYPSLYGRISSDH